jgi:hypothetical protein
MAAVRFRFRVPGGGGGDPICRAAGRPRRAGQAGGLAGDLCDTQVLGIDTH